MIDFDGNKYKYFSNDINFVFHFNNIYRLVSAAQAILSSIAGIVVCQSSCKKSFLRASHFMSDGYAWFGAAYFIYDMWYMYKVYIQKQHDKKDNSHSMKCELLKEPHCNDQINESNRFSLNTSHQISFLKFCYLHPVMIIHHTFLASFGLIVIVVNYCYFLKIVLTSVFLFSSNFLLF